MRGLKPSLKIHVYLQQPKTFEEAAYTAKLKDSAPESDPTINAIMNQVCGIVKDLKDVTIHGQRGKPRAVSAFNQPDRPGCNSYETRQQY